MAFWVVNATGTMDGDSLGKGATVEVAARKGDDVTIGRGFMCRRQGFRPVEGSAKVFFVPTTLSSRTNRVIMTLFEMELMFFIVFRFLS